MMDRYFFNLRKADRLIRDPDGIVLPSLIAAREHGKAVATELMRNRKGCGSWRLEIRDDQGRDCGDLLFATVDKSLDHLAPELRVSVERACAGAAGLFHSIDVTRLSLLQLRKTIRSSSNQPYLAASEGTCI